MPATFGRLEALEFGRFEEGASVELFQRWFVDFIDLAHDCARGCGSPGKLRKRVRRELDRQGQRNRPVQEPPPTDDDEAYCSAMADDLVRGALTAGGRAAIPPGCKATIARFETKQKREGKGTFRMDGSETDKDIKRLTAPLPAQS